MNGKIRDLNIFHARTSPFYKGGRGGHNVEPDMFVKRHASLRLHSSGIICLGLEITNGAGSCF